MQSAGGRYRFELFYAVEDAHEGLVACHLTGSQKLIGALGRNPPRIDAVLLDQQVGAGPDFSIVYHGS